MTRHLFIAATLGLTTASMAEAQIHIAPRRTIPLNPAQLSSTAPGAIANTQGIDIRFPDRPPVGTRAPIFIYPYPFFGYGYPYGYGGYYNPYFDPYRQRSIFDRDPTQRPREPRSYTVDTGPPDASRSLLPPIEAAPRTDPTRARFTLKVPEGAEVWLEGEKMEAPTGRERTFVTPELKEGQTYAYDVRVRWQEGGRTQETTRTVTLRAGDEKSFMILGGG